MLELVIGALFFYNIHLFLSFSLTSKQKQNILSGQIAWRVSILIKGPALGNLYEGFLQAIV